MRNPRNLRNQNEKASNDQASSSAPVVTQTKTQCVTCVTKPNPVTQVTQTKTQCVTRRSNPRASNDRVSSEWLRKLRKLREKKDNSVNTPQPTNDPPLLVEAWTPSGIKMVLEADSPEHAAWIQRMNPWRPNYATTKTPENAAEGRS